jgi:A/G-specific adenine glycosylase
LSGFEVRTPLRMRSLHSRLLGWFDTDRRALPWRRHVTAYGTWIAEVMLQQTTVKAVIPYWERFMIRFPDVGTLAAADEETLLSTWSGLGYYRRARSLHEAAQQIVRDRGGCLPRTRSEWLPLPGVGRYTASAIASIAFDEPVGVVDANVRRVLSRWLSDSRQQADDFTQVQLENLADRYVDPVRPGDWNQALMELGSVICTPVAPRCGHCPVAPDCRGRAAGWVAQLRPRRRRAATAARLSVLALHHRGRVLLLPAGTPPQCRISGWGRPLRQDVSRLFPGLWSLPCTPWYGEVGKKARGGADGDPAAAPLAAWRRWLKSSGGDLESDLISAGSVRHGITTFRLVLWVVTGSIRRQLKGWPEGARWWPLHGHRERPFAILTIKALQRAMREL